ncbi:UNVERIFIED_ASMBLY: major capsid protein [Shigella phage 2019SD1]|uniref:Major capsid protein n=1 Tax=Shigella phage 2019SD1 TaxID=2848074 RepID=A0A6M5CAR7_9CAUD|nr:major head protein [Shigella phage 2019SD1]
MEEEIPPSMEKEKFDQLDADIVSSYLATRGVKGDASDMGIWTAQELHKIRSAAYEKEYPAGSALRVFPVTNELSDTDKTFEYQMFDKVGYAKIIADYTDDLPTVDALMSSEFGKVFRLGNAFLISIDEIKAGQRTGKSLSTRKANAAQNAHDQEVNRTVFKGSKPHKIISVFDHPNLTKIPSTGWLSNDENTKFLKRLRAILKRLLKLSRRSLMVSTAQQISRKVLSVRMENTTESYLEYFQKQNSGITIDSIAELEDIDGTGTKGCTVYEKDPMNMSIEIPEAFNMLPAQPKDLHFKVPCTSKCTGLTIYRPLR